MLENPASLLKSTIQNFEIEPDIQIISQINKKITSIQASRYEKIKQQEIELEKLVNEYELKINEIQSLEISLDRKRILEEINELNNLKFKLARNYLELENEINELNVNFKRKNQELVELKNLNLLNLEVNNNPNSNVLKLKIYKNFGLIVESHLKGSDIPENRKRKSIKRMNSDQQMTSISGISDSNPSSTGDEIEEDEGEDEEENDEGNGNSDSFLHRLNEDYAIDKVHKLIINNSRTNIVTTLNIDEKDNKLSDYFISNYIWDNL